MRHSTVSHAKHYGNSHLKKLSRSIGGLSAGKLKNRTNRILSKSVQNIRSQSKNVDRVVKNHRYEAMGAAMVAGLCIGYFIKK